MARGTSILCSALLIAASVSTLNGQRRRGRPQHTPPPLGRVEFAVSCAPAVQEPFERGMAALHAFWWTEAGKAFEAAVAADSSCAMAYWGLALNGWGNPFTGGPEAEHLQVAAGLANRAARLPAPTPREKGLIAAVGALYRNAATVPNAARLRAYSDTLARVHRDLPDDVEVSLFYALSLVATAPRGDTTFARQKQAIEFLNPLFKAHPEHLGASHYLIHATDAPELAVQGLDAAQRFAEIAPAGPHAQHIPTHTFVNLGMWDEVIEWNRVAYQAGVAEQQARGVDGVTAREFRALDYTSYAHLQKGQDRAARALAEQAQGLTEVGRAPSLAAQYARTMLEARVPLERGDWIAGALLPLRTDSQFPQVEMLSRFARGLSAARLRDTVMADKELAGLAAVQAELKRRNDTYWATVAGTKRQALAAWTAWARQDTTAALREAHAAAEREAGTLPYYDSPADIMPAREVEGDLLRAAGQYDEARAAYKAVLDREPLRTRSLFGAARSAELAGDRESARREYRKVVTQLRRGDGDRREMSAAEGFLLAH